MAVMCNVAADFVTYAPPEADAIAEPIMRRWYNGVEDGHHQLANQNYVSSNLVSVRENREKRR